MLPGCAAPRTGLVEALTGGPVSLSGTTSDLVREESPRVAKRRRSLTYRLAWRAPGRLPLVQS